jgi:lysophospholipase L1-like esterase
MEPGVTPTGNAAARPRTPLRRKIAVAIAAPLLFVALTEVVLALGGVRVPAYAGLPPGVSDYWIPWEQAGKPAGYQRAFPRRYRFRPEPMPVFLREKPSNGYRVFVLGESSVEGTPYELGTFCDWLQLRLTAMLPGRAVEVVNTGNPGWHATEIRTLLQECLRHGPDAIVWMVGHNEMVPQNVQNLRNEIEHPWKTAVYSGVRRLRISSLLTQLGLTRPEARIVIHGQGELTARRCVGAELPLLQARFREATEGAVLDALRGETPIVLCTLPRNLRTYPPSVSVHREDFVKDPGKLQAWRLAVQKARQVLDERGSPSVAVEYLTRAEKWDDTPAELHFLMGCALERIGKSEDAVARYRKALDNEGCPMRAQPWVEAAIREVAGRHRTPLVDLERVFDQSARLGLAGDELICDNVHPNLDGHERIADEILRIFESSLGIPLDRSRDVTGEAGRKAIGLDIYRRFEATRSECVSNLRRVLETGKLDELYRSTRDQCESVLKLQPEQWEVSAALGMLKALSGDPCNGKRLVESAMARDEYVLTSYIFYHKTQPPFRIVLDKAGVDIAAAERNLTPGQRTQLQNRLQRQALR